ncbi:16S rRNA (guanine527-N7)-methyltransferase [Cohaesibacter sp. ES.047]|uniref:16S rRNA (guanine(527)-N(7))-methyltransferase RsmG n=1 Tax=Cohaesibacter sp. ES.047 TaxID=1798205 RepID=UPI000BBFAF63|nr:16S rRNA (guanine(527)-N(7))-methyltransferase RsmG [Cohaesibacter sp. ES.047]SNY90524.1 16S rRNA (guanine527-N7)-methyltransferase [Cohaesibacter sp. ES.047]
MTSGFETHDSKARGLAILEEMFPVSRESIHKLGIYEAIIRKWQPAQNLVAPKTLNDIWLRHIADSAQIYANYPQAKHWIDLGSGAGFPGLVTAVLLDQQGEDYSVNLIESNGRKASFLRTAAREIGVKVTVHNDRIEKVLGSWDRPVEAISARALTSFDNLCDFVHPFLSKGCAGVFHKGRDFDRELEEASVRWNADLVQKQSRTDPDARIVILHRLSSKDA